MLGGLDTCAALLARYGGHKAAAGLTIEAARIRELRTRINEHADTLLGPDDLRPRLRIDDVLGFSGISGRVAAQIASLAPFGPANPRPVFSATGVDIVDGPRRVKERHYKMALRHDGRLLRAMLWRGADRHGFLESHKARVDVAFSIEQNQWNGEIYLEVSLCDVRPSSDAAAVSAPARSPVPAQVAPSDPPKPPSDLLGV
jgi:single-stranded-DNA-specific exonuclease